MKASKATRRRQRSPDPLATPVAVRRICVDLRESMPAVIPANEGGLLRFLYAVRHIERHPVTDSKRGRPPNWKREDLYTAAGNLRSILERETGGRVSLSSFIAQYLPLLRFPTDVIEALLSGQLNLQETAQLARLTPERMGCSKAEARKHRLELLRSHMAVQGSQTRLRAQVKELLGEAVSAETTSQQMTTVMARVDHLLEIDPQDTRHFFWEEMKRLFFAMREIELDDLDDQIMEEFLSAMDGVSNILVRIEKRRRERQRQLEKVRI
ncbi:MAG: hypothetical protein M3R15_17345 [Acidobacteriota bacterium]|nr:hypothetical protein [Acidobacteriota bacterium]